MAISKDGFEPGCAMDSDIYADEMKAMAYGVSVDHVHNVVNAISDQFRFALPGPADDLNDFARLAICIAAGAKAAIQIVDGSLEFALANRCAVVDRDGGGYMVFVGEAV